MQKTEKPKFAPIREVLLEKLARLLVAVLSHADITRLFKRLKFEDSDGPRWSRILHACEIAQSKTNTANPVLRFVQLAMDPARFIDDPKLFLDVRTHLNKILAFCGLKLTTAARYTLVDRAVTIKDAQKSVEDTSTFLNHRNLHDEITKHCKNELLQENYFHAMLEAIKGLEHRIRVLSGVTEDGDKLVDLVFLTKQPILAFNSRSNQTELSVHRGLAFLLKGILAAVRNPLAHQPKIAWEDQEHAADYLSIISLLHKKLDNCKVKRTDAH